MSNNPKPGFIYILEHPAMRSIGICKLGLTRRDPAKRLSEITSSSGLIAPGRIAFCKWVSDCRSVERAIKEDILRHKRVRKRRELFRVSVEEAQAAIERAAACCVSSPWDTERPAIRKQAYTPKPKFSRYHPFRLGLALRFAALLAAAVVALYGFHL